MTTTKSETTVLEIKRTLRAPVEKVFKAWTEPDQITKWFGCEGTINKQITQDFRVGGDYKYDLTAPDGKILSAYGTFKEIVPNRKLVYSWNNTSIEHPASDTLVSIEFIDKGDATEIILNHSKFTKPSSVEGHTLGWTTALDKFEVLFA
jgi:uncharacterized protein YndB with AHSA1/START domain